MQVLNIICKESVPWSCYTRHMSDSLGDILKNKRLALPEDGLEVKVFIEQKLKQSVSTMSKSDSIIIITDSSAQAGFLRPYLHIISRDCNIGGKKLFIRVSHESF